jgi:mannosyltransferase OCH1-like enzyme
MSKLQVVAKGKGAFQGKLDRLRVLHPRTMAKLSGEMPSYRLGDRPEQAAWHHSNIPGVLYQTSESNLLGKSHYREVQRFRDLNPGIRFEFFDRSQRDQYMRRHWRGHLLLEIYENALFGPMKADLFRYCILWQRGGMYCDIKSRFLLPIDEILDPSAEVVIAYENRFANVTPPASVMSRLQHPQRLALQWALMVAPEHPMLRNVLDSIVHNAVTIQDVCFEHPQAAICRFTGPGCYTQALWSWVATEHPLSGLQQAGIDFEGCAEYSMPGAWSRWALNPHYSLAEHSLILKSAAA